MFIEFGIGAFFGCLLPDIDHQNSIMGDLTPIHRFLKHAGITHSLIIICLVFIPAYYYTKSIVILGVGFGCVNHAFGDNFDGHPLKNIFWPIYVRKIKKKVSKTNKNNKKSNKKRRKKR